MHYVMYLAREKKKTYLENMYKTWLVFFVSLKFSLNVVSPLYSDWEEWL